MPKLKTFSKKTAEDLAVDQLKVTPHSLEAERAVLGGLMLDNRAFDRIADRLTAKDFYRVEHRHLFEVISQLSQKNTPFDVLTIADSLKQNNIQNVEEIYLYELAQNTPSAANIIAYADIVRERSVLRQLIEASQSIADSAYFSEGRSSHDLIDNAERMIFKISDQGERRGEPQILSHLLAKATERIDQLYHSGNSITGMPTGFADLDEMTSGLQAGDLVICAGRPSMGKTAFAMNIAENAAIKTKMPVLVFSMEMPGDQLAMRMLSSLGRIDQHRLRTGKLTDQDWASISSNIALLSSAPIYIDDTAALNPTELRSRARRLTREQGKLGLIVIDYVQLMQVPGFKENRTLEISEISRSLKILAKELSVPVIALSQLNRSLEQRHDRRPVMSDLRESGSLEQDADLICFIYRDEVYNEDSPEKGIAEIIISKQRNGPIGKVKLAFQGKYTRFDNLSLTSG